MLDDVRAHFADAAEAGSSPEQAVASLGDPATFTARVRAELGHEPGRTDRIRRILQWLATGVAVFTVMFVTFLLPDSGEDFDEPGFEIVLLLGIALSFGLAVLITIGRAWAGVVLAVGGVALLIVSPLDPGMLVLAFWWAGGLFLTVGASHALAHARLRKPAQK